MLQHMPALEEVDLSDTVVGNGALEDLPRFNRKLRCINLSYSGLRALVSSMQAGQPCLLH